MIEMFPRIIGNVVGIRLAIYTMETNEISAILPANISKNDMTNIISMHIWNACNSCTLRIWQLIGLIWMLGFCASVHSSTVQLHERKNEMFADKSKAIIKPLGICYRVQITIPYCNNSLSMASSNVLSISHSSIVNWF